VSLQGEVDDSPLTFQDGATNPKTPKMTPKRPEPILFTNFFPLSAKKIEKSFAQ
jgi:hypothetical protein